MACLWVIFSLAVNVFAIKIEESIGNPYKLSNITYTEYGITAIASYTQVPQNNSIVLTLWVNIVFEKQSRVRIQIKDYNNERWEVPNDFLPYSIEGPGLGYNVTVSDFPMGISVYCLYTNKVIFNLDPFTLFRYNDQDIYFENNLNYNISLMGLGERICPFIIPPGTYTMWSRDRESPYDDGQSQEGNMYSVHPMYIAFDPSDYTAFGGFFFNSNAMQAIIGPNSIAFRTTGGIIDFWLFVGPGLQDVTYQYDLLIGPPTAVPYWSLGWHQSRYGYQNITVLNSVLDNYMKYNLPLDAIWSDIDYMYIYEDFQMNPVTYPLPNVTRFISKLHILGKHYVPIIDAGIAQNNNYISYTEGLAQNVFVQSAYNITNPPTPTVGVVWPGNATFIDWLNPNATKYWTDQLLRFQDSVAFSGIWTDMNEIANFINGEVGHPPSIITNLTMPFTPGQDINIGAMDVASTHYGNVLEYNFHSLYGYNEAKASNNFFTQVLKTRPFIISRSSFPGHGRFGSKWLGDNFSKWGYLQASITGVFNFGIFGIPMIGADVCGFLNNTTQELCQRWMQLGTLYPFSRNHNDIASISQEPWAFGPELLKTSNLAIRNKYMLYLYFYSQLTYLNLYGGTPFWHPAFFDYSSDPNLIANATNSFMLGFGLIVHPCLWANVTGSLSLFPNEVWFNLYTGKKVELDHNNMAYLEMPLEGLINIHISQGFIVPIVDSYKTAMCSGDTRNSNISLIIARSDHIDNPGGFLIFDDGYTDTAWYGFYNVTQVNFEFQAILPTLDAILVNPYLKKYTRQQGEWPFISNLILYGCDKKPTKVVKKNSNGEVEIDTGIVWDRLNNVCRISLGNNLEPDEACILYISYIL